MSHFLFFHFIFFFFFNDTATTEIYTLSLHDALPISGDTSIQARASSCPASSSSPSRVIRAVREASDRKSTRLNSSHVAISYAVFCLKKKKQYVIKLHVEKKKKTKRMKK